VGGLAVALWFFTANDDATTSAPAALAPGTPATDPPAWASELRDGNLLLMAGDATQAGAARALARDVAGADWSPPLRQAGQAIRVVRAGDPGTVTAYAHDRTLTTARADDPALRGFLEYWLGRAAG
jgi:hypothetical protein